MRIGPNPMPSRAVLALLGLCCAPAALAAEAFYFRNSPGTIPSATPAPPVPGGNALPPRQDPNGPVLAILDVTPPASAVAGVPFTARAIATGGPDIKTWSLWNGLPTWLRVAPDGTVTGTPPESLPSFSYVVTGTDAAGRIGLAEGTVLLRQPTLSFALPASLIPGDVVSVRLDTNLPEATFSLTSGPGWLGAEGGLLTGTVPANAVPGTVTAMAASGTASVAASTPLAVQAVGVEPDSVPESLRGGQDVAGRYAATAGQGWSYGLVGAPAWLTVDPASGALAGTAPNAAGGGTIRVRASRNGVGVDSAPLALSVTPSTIGVSGLPGKVRTGPGAPPIRAQASASWGQPSDWSWALDNATSGLVIGPDGAITGQPSASATFRVRASRKGVDVLSPDLTLGVAPALALTGPADTTPLVGTPFSTTVKAANFQAGVTWSATGSLPAGIRLTTSGDTATISGTAQNATSTSYTLTATDPWDQGSKSVTLTFTPSLAPMPLPRYAAAGNPTGTYGPGASELARVYDRSASTGYNFEPITERWGRSVLLEFWPMVPLDCVTVAWYNGGSATQFTAKLLTNSASSLASKIVDAGSGNGETDVFFDGSYEPYWVELNLPVLYRSTLRISEFRAGRAAGGKCVTPTL